MGRDKALLPFAGKPLVAHALSILIDAGLSASISGAQIDLSRFGTVLADPQPNLGPLSGICAALASINARYAVFLPVDLPLLPPQLLVCLLRYAQVTGCPITVPSVSGFTQTFPAVIDRVALSPLQAELDAGRSGCFSAFQIVAVALGQPLKPVAVELVAQPGRVVHPHGLPPVHWFVNLNTPADLDRAEALLARRIA